MKLRFPRGKMLEGQRNENSVIAFLFKIKKTKKNKAIKKAVPASSGRSPETLSCKG